MTDGEAWFVIRSGGGTEVRELVLHWPKCVQHELGSVEVNFSSVFMKGHVDDRGVMSVYLAHSPSVFLHVELRLLAPHVPWRNAPE
jgi:hypothetical protein